MGNIDLMKGHHATRILVVDDEKRIRDGCCTMLHGDGFDVEAAENGFVGLKKIDEEHFDIILLDLMMPGLPGIELLSHVKTKHPDTLVIVITGYATLEHAIDAMKKGAFDFISKPFSPDDLRSVIGRAIDYIRTLGDIAYEKSRMRVLINHISDGVMATDMQKIVALANPAFLKMIGHTEESPIGKSVKDLIQDERLIQVIDEALSMPPETFGEVTEEFDGGLFGHTPETVIAVRCVPFRDRLHRNLGTLTVLHDITALKKMDKLKSDFVSMVAHEIKNPMGSVLALVKVVQDGLAGDLTEKQREILGRVSEKIKGLADMSQDLLDLSRIESGLISLEKERIDVRSLLIEQTGFYQGKAEEKGISMIFEPAGQLPPILGSKRAIEEVISNFLTNAVKYTPENGRVMVFAAQEGDYVHISVKDNGFGIAEDDLSRVFDRFYRVKNDKTRYISGTGLGLAIVKSIVEAHNGTVRAESEVNVGSTFHVFLPVMIT